MTAIHRCLTAVLLFSAVFAAAEDAPESAAEFLQKIRMPKQNVNSYAKLTGSLSHQRSNRDELLEYPVYFGMAATPQKTLVQLILNRAEGYYVGQTGFSGGSAGSTSIIPMKKGGYPDSIAAYVGLDPTDLAMSFVFYDLERELEPASFRAVGCRVLLLKKPGSDEFVKLTAAEKYFFPLKAEFFHGEFTPEKAPYRTLEVSSFKKQNDLYFVRKLDLYGPGWRTRVDFSEAEVDTYTGEIPPGVIRSL